MEAESKAQNHCQNHNNHYNHNNNHNIETPKHFPIYTFASQAQA